MKRNPIIFSSIAAIIIAAVIPLFVHSPFYIDLLIMILVNTMLAITFIMLLRTGLISLGIAAFWGMGAYTSAVLVMKLGLSFWVSLPLSAVLVGIIALILGYPLIRSPGFTFAVLTGVIGMLFTEAVGNIPYLGGHNGISNIPNPDAISIPFLPPIEFDSTTQFFYLALFLFVVVVLICKAFYSAWIGRAWTAIGLNYRLAESLGVNVFMYKLASFILASFITGLCGSFYAHYQGFIVPDSYGMFTTIYIHVYAVLGGVGHAILGPLVGSTLMAFFPELMRTTREIAPIFTGLLLVVLIMFLPGGLLSLLTDRTTVNDRFTRINKAIKSLLSGVRRPDKT